MQINQFPESGGRVLEFDDPTIRELIEGNYRIIYRLQAGHAEVLAVVHGAKQLPDPPSA
jgi:plasmid stabilization system protein ParE